MEFLFGKRKTPQEMLRENQRALNKAMREMDRERTRLEAEEKKIIFDIKKMDSVRVMAKDLVRTRQHVKKFIIMKANIQAVALKVQTLKSQDAMAQAMRGVTRAMKSMNQQLNLPQIQRIMSDFERQSEMMDMKEEMMGDAIDDALEQSGDEEESENIVNQVLDELGIHLEEQMNQLPATGGLREKETGGKQPQPLTAEGGSAVDGSSGGGGGGGGGSHLFDIDADLQARLENLRRE